MAIKIPFYHRGHRLVGHVIGQFDALVHDLDAAAGQISAKQGRNEQRLAKIRGQQAMLGRAYDRSRKVAERIAQLVAE